MALTVETVFSYLKKIHGSFLVDLLSPNSFFVYAKLIYVERAANLC